MNQQMDPDEAVERVLTGLRHTGIPEGMERRIVDAAQHGVRHRTHWPSILPMPLLRFQQRTVAALGVIILSLAASTVVHRKAHVRREAAVATLPLMSPIGARPTPPVEEVQVAQSNHGTFVTHRPFLASKPNPEPLSAEEALALSEMNAPSKPAPPLPLTHQEKLLAEAAHQADPEELSSLRPEIRARQMELSKAEFRDFFEPPPARANQ